MSKKYINNQIFQSGIQFNTQYPLDDRLVMDGIESLYISTSSSSPYYYANEGTLYGKAYSGMPVIVHTSQDNVVDLMILRDATPYTPGQVTNINQTNVQSYWKTIGSGSEEYIHDVIDAHLASLDASVIRIDDTLGAINSSIIDLSEQISSGDQHYNDSAITDDSFATLTDHGNLPAGTTVGDLKNMSISHILTQILFEIAAPVKTQSSYVTIEWKSDSVYKSTVDVGINYPSTSDMEVTFYPEKYNWTSKQDSTISGTPVNTTTQGTVSYLFNGNAWNPNSKITTAGQKSPFYATVVSVAGNNAVDSLGSEKDSNNEYYRSGAEAATENGTVSSLNSSSKKSLSVTAAWRYYSNASATYTSKTNAWSNKSKTGIPAYKGDDDMTEGDFVSGDSKTIWLQWPKLTNTQHAFVYIPEAYKITRIAGASDVNANTFNVDVVTNPASVETVAKNNRYNVQYNYKKYEINKMGNITTVEILIEKI